MTRFWNGGAALKPSTRLTATATSPGDTQNRQGLYSSTVARLQAITVPSAQGKCARDVRKDTLDVALCDVHFEIDRHVHTDARLSEPFTMIAIDAITEYGVS